MKLGLAQWELDQLVADLKAGKSWDDVVRTRCGVLAPGVLEASDYKAYAHRQAGVPLPEVPATPASVQGAQAAPAPAATAQPEVEFDGELEDDAGDVQAEVEREPEARRGGRGRGGRGR